MRSKRDERFSRACFSMFFNKRGDKLRLEKRSPNRIPTRWKLVIAGLIGSGTGLLILTMWSPDTIDDNSSSDRSSESNPDVKFLGRNANVELRDEEKSSGFCTISSCNAVTCLSIPESLNPGLVASDFITQIFKAQCPSSNTIELTFQSCKFPNNRLERNWLMTNLPIETLAFRDCPLENFSRGSFASTIFTNLRTLDVSMGKISILEKFTFDELRNLKNLLISDNIVYAAEYDLLNSVADSLEILVLDGCLKDIGVLANITGRVSLGKVQIFSIQRNSLGRLTAKIFQSIPNVVSIYLEKSEIETIDADTLKNARSLKLLDLKNNLLKKLPYGMLDTVLAKNPDFKIAMTDNPWNCSCDFEWIIDLMKNYPGTLLEIPKCETPRNNALLYFTNAKFCENSTVHSTTARALTTSRIIITETTRKYVTNEEIEEEEGEEEGEENSLNYVKFTCQNYDESLKISRTTRKLFSTEEWKFPSRYHDFSVRSLENGDIMINLKINESKVSIIWFRNNEFETEETNDTTSGTTIECVKDIESSFVLKNLASDATYTICLLMNLEKSTSPLNCLAAKTRSMKESRNDVWLTNDDKSIAISITVFLLIIIILLSVVSSFFLIRRNPSLLRGSKRIVMVKKRGIDALVMPRRKIANSRDNNEKKRVVGEEEKWSNDPCLRKYFDNDYLTPVQNRKSSFDRKYSSPREPTRRKDSKVSGASSRYSAGSYVSGIEATPSELYNWRNNARMKNYYATCVENDVFEEEETPPLPPHRSFDNNNSIPSLSLAVDSVKRGDTFQNFYIERHDDREESSTLRK